MRNPMLNMSSKDNWSHIGGCSMKHPFNKEKRAECESSYLSKKGVTANETKAQADLLLAQAVQQKAMQNQKQDDWTPERTAKVLGITLGILALTAITIVVIRKRRAK